MEDHSIASQMTVEYSKGSGRERPSLPSDLPIVTVVIPVFNAAPYLRESIDSVLTQNYPSVELIVVDDGSTDASMEILQSYGARVRVLSQKRRGPGAARNLGVRTAQGDYIAFLDADDVWLPGKLSAQMSFIREHSEFEIVFGQFAFWRPDAKGAYPEPSSFLARPDSWEIKQALSGNIYADELLESCIPMITPIIHRKVFDALGGFDESLLTGSDYDFWLKATHRFRAHKMPACFAAYRIHEESVTGTPRKTNYPFMVIKRALDTFGTTGPDGRTVDQRRVAQRLAGTWLFYANVHIERGSKRLALKGLVQYVRYAPQPHRAFFQCISPLVHILRSALGLSKR